MLVLSRKKNEEIVIGSDGGIRIVIVDIRGDKVRLGIECDKSVPVHRREVFDAIQRNGGVDLKRGAGVTGEKNNGDGASRSGGENGSKAGSQPNASPAS
jgi:carbon storage regulator